MNKNIQLILTILKEYLEKNPDIRFCQALFNLNITELADKNNPSNKDYLLRDPYNDNDLKVLNRIQKLELCTCNNKEVCTCNNKEVCTCDGEEVCKICTKL